MQQPTSISPPASDSPTALPEGYLMALCGAYQQAPQAGLETLSACFALYRRERQETPEKLMAQHLMLSAQWATPSAMPAYEWLKSHWQADLAATRTYIESVKPYIDSEAINEAIKASNLYRTFVRQVGLALYIQSFPQNPLPLMTEPTPSPTTVQQSVFNISNCNVGVVGTNNGTVNNATAGQQPPRKSAKSTKKGVGAPRDVLFTGDDGQPSQDITDSMVGKLHRVLRTLGLHGEPLSCHQNALSRTICAFIHYQMERQQITPPISGPALRRFLTEDCQLPTSHEVTSERSLNTFLHSKANDPGFALRELERVREILS